MSQQESGYGGYGSASYREPHRGVLILALAIAGFFISCGLTSPFAWWMGRADMQKIRTGTMDPSGESMTRAGHLLGIVGTLMVATPAVLGLVLVVLYFFAVVVLGIAGVALGS